MQTCFARSGQLLDVPRLRGIWEAMRALPRGPAGDVMHHGDLIPGNVLVSGGRLAGILDAGGLGQRATKLYGGGLVRALQSPAVRL
jgi:aminoglycoside phosphotransferase (APT) family kinase protein